jgi:selenocysteine lyase/cysteine desulfurase
VPCEHCYTRASFPGPCGSGRKEPAIGAPIPDVAPPSIDWKAVRAAFPTAGTTVYLNTGTVGLRPRPVVDRLLAATGRLESGGRDAYPELVPEVDRARAKLADLLGAQPEEIALCGNATDAINWVVAGLDWSDGDEVLLSAQEHPAMLWPWTYLQQRRAVRLRRFPISADPERCLAEIRPLCGPRTRLIASSHVSTETGTRVPAGEIAAWARERGILTLFDGAQAIGDIPVDVGRIGSDFYAGNGHKWLCGPTGTGFLWGRLEQLTRLWPAHVGAGSAGAFAPDGLTLQASGKRFEYGTRDYARWVGMTAALDWLAALGGVAAIGERLRALATYLRDAVRERPGWTLLTPEAWDGSSALTTFRIEGWRPAALQAGLEARRPRIITRQVPEHDALRISTHYFNDESDIEALLEELEALVGGARG